MRYGIWYKNRDWAIKQLDEAIKEYTEGTDIKVVRKFDSTTDYFISLSDGSYFRIVPAIEGMRGCRFNVIQIEDDIDEIFIKQVILPHLTTRSIKYQENNNDILGK